MVQLPNDLVGKEPDPARICEEDEGIRRILDAIDALPLLEGYLVLEVSLSGVRLGQAASRVGLVPRRATVLLWQAKKRLWKELRA